MRHIILALLISLSVISCTKNTSGGDDSGKDSLPANSFIDVSYGSNVQQKMDIYLPALRNTEDTRLIIIIHGGGWTSGDKSEFTNYITEFQKRLPGYAFANLNYRLATEAENYFPAQENDMLSAINFLKDKSKDYHISNDYIFLGISAGAHLAMLQGYKHSNVLKPKGIISFFGPTDLEKLYASSNSVIPSILKTILGASPEENRQIFTESSPINYLNGSSSPTLMLHGDKDELVPLAQATLLHQKLDMVSVSNKLVVYPGQGHGWIGDDLTDSFNQVESFIKGLAN